MTKLGHVVTQAAAVVVPDELLLVLEPVLTSSALLEDRHLLRFFGRHAVTELGRHVTSR